MFIDLKAFQEMALQRSAILHTDGQLAVHVAPGGATRVLTVGPINIWLQRSKLSDDLR